MGESVRKNPQIRGLALNFTRIKNKGLKALCDSFKTDTYKSKRSHDRGLYSLDLTNNYIEGEGILPLIEIFHD